MGDSIQYFGTRRLWARLSNDAKLKVDIIDVTDMKYIKKDVKIGSRRKKFRI